MSLAPQSIAYKESGIPWLGKIPEHWRICKFKYFAKVCNGKEQVEVIDENGQYLIYGSGGVIGRANGYLYDKTSVLLGRKGTINKPLFVEEPFWTIDTMFYTRIFKIAYPKFFFYLCLNIDFDRYASGSAIPSMTQSQLEDIKFPLPPFQEQKAIADFLDKKTHQIEDFIAKKQKLITLLEEKKQTLINQCVTQGLDSSTSLKDSGVEWLGKIPTHWEMIRLGIAYPNIGSGTTPRSDSKEYYDGGSIVWVNSGDLNDSLLINSEKKVTEKALKDYPTLKIYPKNSIVVAMYGATIGKASVLGVEACVNQACCVLPKSSFFEYPYVFYWFVGSKKYIIEMGVGGGQPNISQEIIKNLKIPLPPLEEQKAIAEYLDTQITKIDLAISKIKSQINLIKEYKSTLISEAVCGRVGIT